MTSETELLTALLSASPTVLSLLVALAVIGLAGFAIYVVHLATRTKEKD